MKYWKIQYSQSSNATNSIQCEFSEMPSREHAAQLLRDVLFNPFIIPDTPRGIAEKTVWQLEQYGVRIHNIIEIANI